MVKSSVLSYFDSDQPVRVSVQKEHPLAYAARALTEAQTYYSQIEKERHAVCFIKVLPISIRPPGNRRRNGSQVPPTNCEQALVNSSGKNPTHASMTLTISIRLGLIY